MYSIPSLVPACSMSSSNCCSLTCIQISQEEGKVIWYSHLFKNFLQFVVIYTVKGFDEVNKAAVFLECSFFFFMIQQMLAIWSLVPLTFLNSACASGSSQFMDCWSLAWRILRITLLACDMSTIVHKFEHSLALPFFGIGMKTDLFQSSGHCWVFQICWHIECSTLTEASFRILNSSTGIPWALLALFLVMLPKPTWLRISGCLALGEWSHHRSYLGREDFFVQSFCVFLSLLLNIFCFC